MVKLGVCTQIPRAGRVLDGGHQRLRPCLENLTVGRITIPTLADKGYATIVRHHQFQNRLFQVRPVISGVAAGDGDGVLIALRDVLAAQRKAGCVEMIEAQVNAFVGTDRQGKLLKQQVAAIGMGLIKCPAKLEAVEHLGRDALTKQEIEGLAGKKLWRQGQGPIGKAQAVEDHPSDGFARRDHFLVIGHETSVDHVNEAYVCDPRSNHT